MARYVMPAAARDGRRFLRTDITPRQADILALTTVGCSTRQIGERLGIRPKTVNDHRHSLYLRLGITAPNPGPVAAAAWARGALTVTGAADDQDH